MKLRTSHYIMIIVLLFVAAALYAKRKEVIKLLNPKKPPIQDSPPMKVATAARPEWNIENMTIDEALGGSSPSGKGPTSIPDSMKRKYPSKYGNL